MLENRKKESLNEWMNQERKKEVSVNEERKNDKSKKNGWIKCVLKGRKKERKKERKMFENMAE